MDTTGLKKFAQDARRQLLEQVATRLEQLLRSGSVEIREKANVFARLKEQIELFEKKEDINRDFCRITKDKIKDYEKNTRKQTHS